MKNEEDTQKEKTTFVDVLLLIASTVLITLFFIWVNNTLEKHSFESKATQVCKNLYGNETKFILTESNTTKYIGACNGYKINFIVEKYIPPPPPPSTLDKFLSNPKSLLFETDENGMVGPSGFFPGILLMLLLAPIAIMMFNIFFRMYRD